MNNKKTINEMVKGLRMELLWIGMNDGRILMQANVLIKNSKMEIMWFNAYLNKDFSLDYVNCIIMEEAIIYSHEKGVLINTVPDIYDTKEMIKELIKRDRLRVLTGVVKV